MNFAIVQLEYHSNVFYYLLAFIGIETKASLLHIPTWNIHVTIDARLCQITQLSLLFFLVIFLIWATTLSWLWEANNFWFLACKLWSNTNLISSYQFQYSCQLSYNMHAYKEKPT
jgi:hypothetical protein